MTSSNQYPRLPWVVDPEATSKPSYRAEPHGPGAGLAWIYFQRTNLDGQWWYWAARWPGRFSKHGMLHSKQDAADRATIAYWDCMEATEGWSPAPVPPPPLPYMPTLPEMRFYRWVDELIANMTDETAPGLVRRFLIARGRGPSISGNNEADLWAHQALSDAFGTRSYRRRPGVD